MFFLSAVIEGCFRGCLPSACFVGSDLGPNCLQSYKQTALVLKGFKCLLEVCLFETN